MMPKRVVIMPVPLMAYGIFALLEPDTPVIVPGTSSGGFMLVALEDSQTVRATF